MPRRYVRTGHALTPRLDVPVASFPSGEGPQIGIRTARGAWQRLGLGISAVVPFGGEGGAFAWGMTASRVLIWVHPDLGGAGTACCQHLPLGPITPLSVSQALWELECEPHRIGELIAVVAAPTKVAESDEHALTARGVRPDRLFTYSGCLVPQFGVSAAGCVGEAV